MSGCHWYCYFVPKTLSDQNAAHGCSNQMFSFSSAAVVFSSWVNRRRRYLLLILCSPFLFPLFCALCPLLFMADICFLICRRRQKAAAEKGGVETLLCVEDGDEVRLLQRYLEDQMLLVVGSGYKFTMGSTRNTSIVRGLLCNKENLILETCMTGLILWLWNKVKVAAYFGEYGTIMKVTYLDPLLLCCG